MEWKNGSSTTNKWSVNFDVDEDFYDINVTPEKHVFIISDDTSKLAGIRGNLLVRLYQLRNQTASFHMHEDVVFKYQHTYINGVPVLKNDLVLYRSLTKEVVMPTEFIGQLTANYAT